MRWWTSIGAAFSVAVGLVTSIIGGGSPPATSPSPVPGPSAPAQPGGPTSGGSAGSSAPTSGASTRGAVSGGATTGGATSAPPTAAQLQAGLSQRQQSYLQLCAQGFQGLPSSKYTQIARLETSIGPIERNPIEAMCQKMDLREDTADFDCATALRILYLHGSNPLLPSDLKQRLEDAVLNFKFWIDEPGKDEMVYWSENHQIIFASSEYLAGQMFPQRVFTNDGRTGLEHMQSARVRILRWFDHRLRFGFSEWNSQTYYPHDMSPLCNLADFAQDLDIETGAAMCLDILLFDLARLAHKGHFGVTAGRVYEEYKLDGRHAGIGDVTELLFGTRGFFVRRGSTGAIALATARRYKVPQVILAIGQHVPDRQVDRARVGISVAQAQALGIGTQTLEEGMFWWGQGCYMAPEVIELSRRMIFSYGLEQSGDFKYLVSPSFLPGGLYSAISKVFTPFSEGNNLTNANLYAFRTPDGLLSSAQSYNKGKIGYQQHAWQATLDLDAVVFTTAQGRGGRYAAGPWTGSWTMPKVFQHEDTAIILYNTPVGQQLAKRPETHAYFPRAQFDEVVDDGHWTFGRKGDGYVALYVHHDLRWTTSGPHADAEIVSEGSRNVWICQLGRAAEDGPFLDFQNAVRAARLRVGGLRGLNQHNFTADLEVWYEAPGLGELHHSWQGDPTVAGQPVAVRDYPRFDNPYAQQAFDAPTLRIEHQGLVLDHDRLALSRSGDGL